MRAKTVFENNAHLSTNPTEKLPVAVPGEAFRFFEGIKILDLTTSIAGPYATMLLADMGADVVKVERIGVGDDSRAWGPPFLKGESLWFLSVNRNKKSLTLNYSNDLGKSVLYDLVRQADVVILNQLQRVQIKLGIDYESLSNLRQDLIFVSLTGFGLDNKRSELPCYDLIAEGYSGVMDLTGEADSDPQKIGTPAADLLAGMDAAFSVATALFDRQKTGQGHKIDISLVESMTKFMMPRIVPYLGSGEVPRRTGAKDSVIAIYQTFQTADAPLNLGLGNDNIWKRFWKAVGHPEVANEKQFASNNQRRNARAEIVHKIQNILTKHPRDYWLGLFADANVPAGPVNRLDEVTQDQHFLERNLFFAIERNGSLIPQVGTAVAIDGKSNGYRLSPPTIGEHSVDILKEWLSYKDKKINFLKEKFII